MTRRRKKHDFDFSCFVFCFIWYLLNTITNICSFLYLFRCCRHNSLPRSVNDTAVDCRRHMRTGLGKSEFFNDCHKNFSSVLNSCRNESCTEISNRYKYLIKLQLNTSLTLYSLDLFRIFQMVSQIPNSKANTLP